MYAEITAAIQSATALADLLKAAKSLSNYNEFVSAVSQVNSKLMAATSVALAGQETQSRLATRISELEAALIKAEDWERQIKRYRLFEFPATGVLAYALQPETQEGEPLHYLCVACVDKKQISRLQPMSQRRLLSCHACNAKIQVELEPKLNRSTVYRQSNSWMV